MISSTIVGLCCEFPIVAIELIRKKTEILIFPYILIAFLKNSIPRSELNSKTARKVGLNNYVTVFVLAESAIVCSICRN